MDRRSPTKPLPHRPMPKTATETLTRTAYLPLRSVKVSAVRQLYDVHERAYEHTSLDDFTQELKRQTGVLALQRLTDGRIVGFSTQSLCSLSVDGQSVRGLFTGPLVVDPEYRSGRGLRQAVFRRLFLERLKHPMAPFYWFFTAAGLQDYLLMTQCFPHHHPHAAGLDQRHLKLAQAYCAQLFPHAFDRHRMLLDFPEGHARLKPEEAPPAPTSSTQDHLRTFFEQANPGWRKGTELPCLAECDWSSLWRGMQGRVLDPQQRRSARSGSTKRGQPS
jgi:hypothetical protein